MFFKKTYEERLKIWYNFREVLATSLDPISTAIEAYNKLPTGFWCTDPYDPESWPSPWELIDENQYCLFSKLLGICYSLQLTARFSLDSFKIHIINDRKNSNTYYLLSIDNETIGFDNSKQITRLEIPKDVQSQLSHSMPALN
jgi:hypothetical protein